MRNECNRNGKDGEARRAAQQCDTKVSRRGKRVCKCERGEEQDSWKLRGGATVRKAREQERARKTAHNAPANAKRGTAKTISKIIIQECEGDIAVSSDGWTENRATENGSYRPPTGEARPIGEAIPAPCVTNDPFELCWVRPNKTLKRRRAAANRTLTTQVLGDPLRPRDRSSVCEHTEPSSSTMVRDWRTPAAHGVREPNPSLQKH